MHLILNWEESLVSLNLASTSKPEQAVFFSSWMMVSVIFETVK